MTVGGLIGLAQQAGAASCPQTGSSVTCSFSNPGAAETWVVPTGVTSAQITVQGAAGGAGAGGGDAGGPGGVSSATVAITPGTSLGIYVGGAGGDGPGCGVGDVGTGGVSGGVPSGGNGGAADVYTSLQACAGGGGGGGSFVMSGNDSPADIMFDAPEPELEWVSLGPDPVLAAGGGGGGGAGSGVDNAGGEGGGSPGGPAGPGHPASAGGVAQGEYSAVGGQGDPGYAGDDEGPVVPSAAHGAGGGGGGYHGGGKGNRNADSGGIEGPSGGGGGGGGYPFEEVEAFAAVPGTSVPAASPAHVVGPVTHGLAAAGSPGAITITYSVPASPAIPTTATVNCSPENDPCVAEPPAGEETAFKVVAFGGDDGATLFAILNGGLPPTCKSVGGQLSPDWVQFGFANPKDGRTWSKRIRVTGTDLASKDAAKRELAQTQICFAAPYKFVVKRGFKLTKPAGSSSWEGLLAHCKSRIVAEAKADNPDLARPCILNRSLVKKGDGFVVRVNYFVPNGELDPQGRSLKKKKKKKP